MITDLANLGPSNRTTSDLGASSKKELGKNSQSEKSGSFDQIFQQKNLEKSSDSKVRSNIAKPGLSPVAKDLDKVNDAAKIENRDQVDAKPIKSEPRTAQKENDGDESGSVKDKGRSEKVGKKSNTQSPNRQEVMLKFMDSMENEFSIPPAKMVEAMTNLSQSELRSSPEDSASQVIAQLNLPKEDEPKAYAMYMALLAQLSQQMPQASQPSPLPFVVAAGAAMVATPPQQRQAMLSNSLDRMNQKFFMQGSADIKPTMAPEGLNPQGSESMDDPLAEQRFGSKEQAVPEIRTDFANLKSSQPKNNISSDLEKLALPQNMQPVDPNSAEAQEMAKRLAALSFAAGTLKENLPIDEKNLQAIRAEQSLNNSRSAAESLRAQNPFFASQAVSQALSQANPKVTPETANHLNGLAGAAGSSAAILGLSQGMGEDEESDDLSGDSSPKNPFFVHQTAGHLAHLGHAEGVATENHLDFGAMMAAAGAQGANHAAAQSENKAAIQQLMNQAEFMIRKGGGEAKVQLNPEGLGEIQMKVSVSDGKVGIQMSAETSEAKKLIEGSLNDLRSSLGQHKLSVEHVKVDVGNQASSNNSNSEGQSRDRQMDMSQNQSREQTREFWNQFNQGGDRRSGFMENTGIRAYGSNRKANPLTPENAAASSNKRPSGSGKGRGLDLVA